jgi:hypothetical protein
MGKTKEVLGMFGMMILIGWSIMYRMMLSISFVVFFSSILLAAQGVKRLQKSGCAIGKMQLKI